MLNGTQPIAFICVKWGKAYNADYVNILQDMVARNLPDGFKGKFYCMTDDPKGIDKSIEILPIPEDLETWWGKLYMFKRGLFPDGTRCVFMDLDTIITGSLLDIFKYDGKFAILRDVYFKDQLMSAIMMWEAGEYAGQIWDTWEAAGKPRDKCGDQWWINVMQDGEFAKNADVLQDLYPSKIVSYKVNCKPYPPKNTAIVCFHGQPKPDNCLDEWVKQIWKIGGGVAELYAVSNTNREAVENNVKHACSLDIPWLSIKQPNDGQIVIVAGGPSLKYTLDEIKWRVSIGQKVMACNGAAKFLNDNGIKPDYQVIIDARPVTASLVDKAKEYYFASQCDPAVFSVDNVTLFHMNTEGIADVLPKDREANLISSGTTVGLAAMAVAYTQGFRAIHLYGFDSSFSDYHHAYTQTQNDKDNVVDVVVEGESFKTTPWMVKQVQEWQELVIQLANDGVVVTVAGDGLLPHVAKILAANL